MDVLIFDVVADQIKKCIHQECGLNLSQTRILLFFDQTKNQPVTMGVLAKQLNISLSTLSRQLQQQRTASLLTIHRSLKDSSKSVCLNEKGLDMQKQLKQVLGKINQTLFADWQPIELQELRDKLSQISTQFSSKA